jgi:hypothetical protein
MLSLHALKQPRSRRERGAILLLGSLSLPMIVGLLGLATELGMMFVVKARLQMACDGAAIAALRSISLSQVPANQITSATTIADTWFKANISDGYMGISNTSSPPTVDVTNVNNVVSVGVTAQTTFPSYFMRMLHFGSRTINAAGTASRRNVVITLVLDRSGSMNNSNNTYNGQTPCQVMVAATKLFTGMFVPGRDYVGMVSFAMTANLGAAPSTNFQNVLGYTNASGSSTGALDSISCTGGTNTPTGLMLGWNNNYQVGIPGALNVVVLFTDGWPTAGTFSMVTTNATDPTGAAKDALSKSNSTCTDSTGTAIKSGGSMVTNPRNFVTSLQKYPTNSSTNSINLGTGSYFSAISGPLAALYADVPAQGSLLYGASPFFSPTTSFIENKWYNSTDNESPGCAWNGGSGPATDMGFVPPNDIFGNASTGFMSVTTSTILSASRITFNQNNLSNVIHNLTDNAATFLRTANTLPGNVAYPATTIYVVGLGGNGGVNHTLLQRVANDPNASPDGTTYGACSICTSGRGPIGTYIYSADATQLEEAFMRIASEIIRISK